MTDRTLSAADQALKTLTRVLIERVGGLDAAASVLSNGEGRAVRRSQLANYQNRNCDQFMPVDVVGRLEEVAEDVIVTEELARRRGLNLTRSTGSAGACIMTGLASVSRETSDLHTVTMQGLSDGHLSADDLIRIEQELQDLLRVASGLISDIRSRSAGIVAIADRPAPLRHPIGTAQLGEAWMHLGGGGR